jgi:leader peptidase (prepilin peptidase) / N-methyltransferase
VTADLPGSLGPLVAAWCALVGAVVGSFLNVVVGRVPAGESVVSPGSRCPTCKTPIRWYDNVPVASWLVLRARCRACGTRISIRYPLVELAGGALGLVAFLRQGVSGAAAVELAFTATLLALALIDLDTWLLPNAITWPLLGTGLALSWWGITPAGAVQASAYGAGIGFVVFAAISVGAEKLLKKEAMGFGDVWLLAGLGGWMGVGALLPIVLFASIQGSVVGIGLVLLGRGEPGPKEVAPLPGPLPAPPGEGVHGTPGEGVHGTPGEGIHGTPGQGGRGTEEEDDWVPPKHAVPFGPFLVLGAVEWLWFSGPLARLVPVLELFR